MLYRVIAALLVIHIAAGVVQAEVDRDLPGLTTLVQRFSVDKEMGVPAWLSTLLLFFVAQGLWALARQSSTGTRRRWSRHEQVLAIVFVYLSIDELTAIHEQTIDPLQRMFGLGGALAFGWILIALPLVGLLGLLMRGYLLALPPDLRWWAVVAGGLYVAGAAGIEMIGALLWSAGDADTSAYVVVTAVEEGLEMVAIVLFLGVVTQLRVRVGSAPGTASPVEPPTEWFGDSTPAPPRRSSRRPNGSETAPLR